MTTATRKPTKPAGRAPLLAKALESSSMSTTTEDLLTGATTPVAGELQYLALDAVMPAGDNPRSDLGDLTGLAASITAVGVLEPILVRESPLNLKGPAKFQIVAGHRRHAAARLAGLDTIPCIVRVFTEQARVEAMVIENLQRSDLSPFDEARGLSQLVAVGLTQRDIAERVGCSQSHVSKRLSLAALPPAAEQLFTTEKLSVRHVEELAKAPEADVGDIVDGLVRRAKSYKDTLIPDWAIDNEIANLKRDRKHKEAEQAGIASGLTRLKDRPYDHGGSKHHKCKKSEATHWYLASTDITVTWARTQAAHVTANPTPVRLPSEWDLRHEASQRIADFICDVILPKVRADIVSSAVFVASVTSAARRTLERGSSAPAHPLDREFDDVPDDLTDEVYLALALLFGLAAPHWQLPVLEIFVAHGYRTTGVGETFPDGFDPTPILISDADATVES